MGAKKKGGKNSAFDPQDLTESTVTALKNEIAEQHRLAEDLRELASAPRPDHGRAKILHDSFYRTLPRRFESRSNSLLPSLARRSQPEDDVEMLERHLNDAYSRSLVLFKNLCLSLDRIANERPPRGDFRDLARQAAEHLDNLTALEKSVLFALARVRLGPDEN